MSTNQAYMKKTLFFLTITLCVAIYYSCKKNEYKGLDCSTINAKYTTDIKPIIAANCTSSGCHPSYANYADLKSIADNGALNTEVLDKKRMPKSGSLSLDDRKKIKCWIDSGSPNN